MHTSTASNGTVNVLWMQFIFLISGISQTVLVNLISYHGGASPPTLLPVFLSNLASSSVYFLPKKDKLKKSPHSQDTSTLDTSTVSPNTTTIVSPNLYKYRKLNISKSFTNTIMNENDLKIMFLALYDTLCGIISFLALVWSGGAIYQLVYSSIIIITATFRHFLLPNKKLLFKQWIACFIVTFGLLLSGFGQNNGHNGIGKHNDYYNNILEAFSQLFWPLIATILYAIEYVLIEMILQNKNVPISDNELCYKMGFYGLTFVVSYQIINVIPNWDKLFIHQIIEKNGNINIIIVSYLFVFISQYLHNWSYFILLHNSGAVSTGINQACRAVGVFVISGVFFCELQQSQCFNSFKFLSLIIVIIGVLRYAFITAITKHNKNGQLYIITVDELKNKNKHLV